MSTIEATCTACGTINRVGESDVPVGAKFVSCSSCKSRVALPPRPASRATPPPIPSIPTPGAQSVGLADLPAPKRSSPLGGADPSRPAPRSGLAAADLPAPRAARPVPTPTAGTFDLDDLMPGGAAALDDADLPAPKASGGGGRPAVDLSDLPAPRGARPDPVAARPDPVADLPAPRASGHVPKPRPITDLPEVADLPAPSGRPMAPSRATPGPGIADLPAPKSTGAIPAAPRARQDIADLPAPAGPRHQQVADLPTPARKQGVVDLPTPKQPPGVSDVPAPKGFFDDLPQPARGGGQQAKPDLPAPKGFFEDLPGRVNQNKPEVPAPKGFFDDLPGRTNPNRSSNNAPEVPAPKGFFDDLPGRPTAHTSRVDGAMPPAPVGPEVPVPKGFFDDLPQPSIPTRPSAPAPKPVNTPVELQMNHADAALDLGIDPNAGKFDDLDLSKPSAAVVKITDSKPKGIVDPGLPSFKKPSGPPIQQAPATLELAEPRPTASVLPGTQKLGPKRTKEVKGGKVVDPDAARTRARRVRIFALVMLLVTGLGAGGFYFYRRWAAKKAVEETVNEQLAKAKTALAATDLAHWDRAAAAAKVVLDADPKHPDALTIFAEANLASSLALGVNGPGKTVAARKRLADAVAGSIANDAMKRGQALNAILTPGDANRGVELLDPMLKADAKNPVLNLYMGWALAARDDHAGAIKVLDVVATDGKDSIKLHGLYARGQSKLALADLAGARGDFKAILDVDKENIAAQVAMAATRTVAESQDQEKELEAIIALPQFAGADPRAVIRAWNLAAEAAKRGNRFDAARERYRKALAVFAEDIGTLAGFADLELRDGKLDAAAEHINKALNIAKDDARAQVAQSELSILRGDLPDAKARLKNLLERNPPPPKADLAKVRMAAGKLSDAEKDDASAAAHYAEAAQLAGDSDLAPTLAAVAKFGILADKAASDGNSEKANDFRAKADKLLENIRATAEKDVQLALTLGIAYLRTNDASKAEPWLRKYVDARPDEAEGQYQLAKALAKLDNAEDAINRLNKAQSLAPKRTEIGIELALTYERLKREDDANRVYTKLLADNADAGVEVRARAGRYFARRGEIDKAAEQGDAILKVAPTHITGMYLKSEGLIKAAQYDEARQLLGKVTTTEREALYFDALGRANEGKRAQSGEGKYEDQAITAYTTAISIDEKLFNPHAGLGRLYVLRKEHAKAVAPLRRANELDPRNAEVAFNMGVAFMEQRVANPDQAKNAIIWLKAANGLKDTAEGHYRLGTLYFEVPGGGMGKESAAEYTRATHMAQDDEKKLGPKAAPAWIEDALYMEGNAYMRINNLSAAKNAWERFITRAQPGVRKKEVERALATSLNGVR